MSAGAILPQALAIALSPVPLVCILLMLMSTHPVRAGASFAIGWYAALAIVTALVATLTEVGAADLPTGSAVAAVAAVAVFVTTASLTVILPLPIVMLIGVDKATPALKSLETWLLGNLSIITAAILLILAVVLITQSL
jgi:hypothetical protein